MEAGDFIKDAITNNKVVLFMKGTAQFPQCGFSGQVIQILKKIGLKDIATINVLEDDQVRQEIKEFSQWPTIRQLYICLLYTSPSPRDRRQSRMPSSA